MAIPKLKIIVPAIRLIQIRQVALKRCLSKLTRKESMNHQVAEPRKTPSTMKMAERYSPSVSPRRSPAKMAMKERIVSGLVMVRKKVVR